MMFPLSVQFYVLKLPSDSSQTFQVIDPLKLKLKRANVQNNQFNLLINKYTKHKLTIIRCQSQRLISQLFAGK